MKLPRVEFHSKDWSIQWWRDAEVWYFKLCRSWDGQFIVERGAPALPLWGHSRKTYSMEISHTERQRVTRDMRETRWWIPYFMLWRVENLVDHREVFLRPGEKPPLVPSVPRY
jgi:hypothetical protein